MSDPTGVMFVTFLLGFAAGVWFVVWRIVHQKLNELSTRK